MLFRRDRPKRLTFSDYLQRAQAAGFHTARPSANGVKLTRGGLGAIVADGGERPRVVERAGVLMGDEIAALVDGGFQKFFLTPHGVRKPALANDLKAVHEFEEDLREALGLVSLYNQSLGSVSTLYLYDRVKDRDLDQPRKAWEIQSKGSDKVTHH